MNFIQRIQAGTALMLRGYKNFMVSSLVGSLIPYPQFLELNFGVATDQAFKKNELIYAAVEKTANTASQVVLEIHDKRTDEDLENHPLVALLARPNPFMSGFDFWVAVHIYLKLAGDAYFEIERNGLGLPVRLWPLRPDWVKAIPGGPDGLLGYEYRPPGNLTPQVLSAEDVLHFTLFDPMNRYRGLAPVQVAARVVQVDNDATDFIKTFFSEGGVPLGLLSSKMQLQDAQVENIRRRWKERYGGWQNWMEPAVLDSDSTYQRIGMTFQEMGFGVLDSRDEARICMVMDVPPIIVGAMVGLERATYSNYEQARKAWWEDTLFPLYIHLAAEINTQLAPEFGQNIEMVWDFSKVPALTENESDRWRRALQAMNSGGITVNEFREYVGMESAPGRDVFLQPMTVTEIVLGQTSIVQQRQDLSLQAQQRLADNDAQADGAESAPGSAGDNQINSGTSAPARGSASGAAPKSLQRKAAKKPFEPVREERPLEDAVNTLLDEEWAAMRAELEKYRHG